METEQIIKHTTQELEDINERITKELQHRKSQEDYCPYCFGDIEGEPALSRADNETKICSDCGTIEALQNFKRGQA